MKSTDYYLGFDLMTFLKALKGLDETKSCPFKSKVRSLTTAAKNMSSRAVFNALSSDINLKYLQKH